MFTTRMPSSLTRSCCLRLSSIGQNSRLLPPVGVWAVLSPSVADHPLKPATDRRLGEPLPHQLPNQTRADPLPINLSPSGHIRYYPQFPRAIPKQRARSHALLTRPPLTPKGPLDLHVLSLPPAFALSQDQTLTLKRKIRP